VAHLPQESDGKKLGQTHVRRALAVAELLIGKNSQRDFSQKNPPLRACLLLTGETADRSAFGQKTREDQRKPRDIPGNPGDILEKAIEIPEKTRERKLQKQRNIEVYNISETVSGRLRQTRTPVLGERFSCCRLLESVFSSYFSVI
jgi:hypothetical protein